MNEEKSLVKASIRDRVQEHGFNDGHWLTELALLNGEPWNALLPIEGLMDEAHSEVGLTHCGRVIYAVFDDHSVPWPYFGLQAERKNVYRYSSVIQMFHLAFTDKIPLLNSFTRVHCKPSTFDLKVKQPEWTAVLCNECFKQTKHRIVYRGTLSDGVERLYAISVIEQWGETEESILQMLGLHVIERLGRGHLTEY